MKKIFIVLIIILIPLITFVINNVSSKPITGAPPYGIDEEEVPDLNPFSYLHNFTRPDSPPKVGIQVGHFKNNELPDELSRLKGNTGSQGGGKMEWEVNYEIAVLIAEHLKKEGVVVDIIPATVPIDYWADVFIAIHADGNENSNVSGFKFASPWRDFTNKSSRLVDLLNENYEKETGMTKDLNISRNMRGYYAFSWWRFDHAIHPMTVGVIAETGFLTSPQDRKIIVDNPDISAKPIADSILLFLREEKIIK